MKPNVMVLLVGCLSILSGCAGIRIPEMTVKPITEYRFSQEQEGLRIAVDPFLKEERLKTFFGADLLSHGILPLLIVAENLDPKSTYLIEQKSFSFAVKAEQQSDITEGMDHPSVSVPEGARTYETTSSIFVTSTGIIAPGLTLIALPVLLPLDIHFKKIRADIRNINENLEKKAFVDRTISPGELASGFVYFQIKDRESAKKIAIIFMKAKGIPSDKDLNFVLQIKE